MLINRQNGPCASVSYPYFAFFNGGNTEGTNSSKFLFVYVCFVFVWICVRTGFVDFRNLVV